MKKYIIRKIAREDGKLLFRYIYDKYYKTDQTDLDEFTASRRKAKNDTKALYDYTTYIAILGTSVAGILSIGEEYFVRTIEVLDYDDEELMEKFILIAAAGSKTPIMLNGECDLKYDEERVNNLEEIMGSRIIKEEYVNQIKEKYNGNIQS